MIMCHSTMGLTRCYNTAFFTFILRNVINFIHWSPILSDGCRLLMTTPLCGVSASSALFIFFSRSYSSVVHCLMSSTHGVRVRGTF